MHAENSVRQAYQIPANPIDSFFTAPAYTTLLNPIELSPDPDSKTPQRPLNRKSLFSALVKASVEVERVTRQSVRTVRYSFEPPHISAMRTRRQKRLVGTFYAVGTFSFVFAILLGTSAILRSHEQKSQSSVLGDSTNNDGTPTSGSLSENKPTPEDMSSYLVAPTYPRFIRIQSIAVDSRVRRLGLDSKGEVDAPNNINDVGWYDGSVKPGEKDGASIIEAHVAGPTLRGVFWDLNKVPVGAIIEIEKGNGASIKYKVTKTEKVPPAQFVMNKYLTPEISGQHDLKLITSSGKYNVINGIYATRLVVFAQQII